MYHLIVAISVELPTYVLMHALLEWNVSDERNASRVQSRSGWVGNFMPLEVGFDEN